jgi:hypothetical protein
VPAWSYNVPNRVPRYSVSVGLIGAIEGAVTWNGQLPPKLSSACGAIENPTLRVSKDKAVRGAIVYIEKVTVGRNTPYYSKPASVGGMLAKRGCALVPAAQIVAPLPGSVSINGDNQRTKLRVGQITHDLQEGGLVQREPRQAAGDAANMDRAFRRIGRSGFRNAAPGVALEDLEDARLRDAERSTGGETPLDQCAAGELSVLIARHGGPIRRCEPPPRAVRRPGACRSRRRLRV